MKMKNSLLYMNILLPIVAISMLTNTFQAQNTAQLIPLTACDQQYAQEMQRALGDLPANVNSTMYNIAREYTIMLKQQYDLDMKIKELEENTLNTALIALLRVPLSNYAACMTNTSSLAPMTEISID